MARQTPIRLALKALAAARAPRWLPAAPDAAGIVATLHHVAPAHPSAFAPNAHLSITPEFLDAFIGRLKERGWRFVPLTELVLAETSRAGDARRIAITLDDGFRDNFEHAWPVFRRHGAPFTIFVCPGFSDATAELWWEALERIVAGAGSVGVEGEGPAPELPARTAAEKRMAFARWVTWLTAEADEARQRLAIRALAAKYGLDLSAMARERVMDWGSIRKIAADPLCTIGAHTMTHPALARLPARAAFAEMLESADRIEAEVGKRPATIAFPYGYAAAASAREADLAEQAGFAASFTTRPGYVQAAGPRHGLPRVSVNGLYQDVDMLEVLLTPGLWKLRSKIRRSG
jgi:peptidoglycan/xylan/chitin deacetylase (PgdA/CDA1 family)